MSESEQTPIEMTSEERAAEQLMIQRYLGMERTDIEPPNLAPESELSTVFTNPVTAPASLSAMGPKFGTTAKNLQGFRGAAPGVPLSLPIAMSDLIGKSGSYKLSGKIRLDRWDDIMGAGLSPDAKNTWDKSDSTFMPASGDQGAGGGGWNNCFVNSYPFLKRLHGSDGAPAKVTNIRQLSYHFRFHTLTNNSEWSFYGVCEEGGSFIEYTYTYGSSSLAVNSVNAYSVDFVKGGALQSAVINNVTTDQRWARARSGIENGCLIRTSLKAGSGKVNRFTDVYAQIDCDIELR